MTKTLLSPFTAKIERHCNLGLRTFIIKVVFLFTQCSLGLRQFVSTVVLVFTLPGVCCSKSVCAFGHFFLNRHEQGGGGI